MDITDVPDFNNNSQSRYYYNNVLVLNMDNTGKLEWSNVIHKSQYDDESDNFLSYAIMLYGGKLHFLFNELERRNQFLNDQSVTPDGQVLKESTVAKPGQRLSVYATLRKTSKRFTDHYSMRLSQLYLLR